MASGRPMGFIRRLFSSFLRKESAAERGGGEGGAELRTRIAMLEMDLQERNQRIATMQKEYKALDEARDRAAASGAEMQMGKLFKRLSGNLSNLGALADLVEAGREAEMEDVIQLIRALEKDMAAAGMERIGRVGEVCHFDPANHQRMSGGSVHAGTSVVVRIPGYRMGGKVLLKVLITTQEANHE